MYPRPSGTTVVVVAHDQVLAPQRPVAMPYSAPPPASARPRRRCSRAGGGASGCRPWGSPGSLDQHLPRCQERRVSRDALVVVTSWTAAPIPWPRCRRLDCGKGGSGLLVTVASSCHVQSSPACGFPTCLVPTPPIP